ncbi:MAG: (2Fe-2S)-binding protein [Terrimesophilobacter sp.]
MSSGRVAGHGMERGAPVSIIVDGVVLSAFEGESIAAAIMAGGENELREHESGEPRGYFCGMGVCFDCVMTVDGVPNTRACVTWVCDGMVVDRQRGAGLAVNKSGDQSG